MCVSALCVCVCACVHTPVFLSLFLTLCVWCVPASEAQIGGSLFSSLSLIVHLRHKRAGYRSRQLARHAACRAWGLMFRALTEDV